MAKGPQHALPSAGPMARLCFEAVGRLASPAVARRLIMDALAAAGLEEMPEDEAGFGGFACGPLKLAVLEALGEEAAEAVMQDLSPAFLRRTPSSGVRRRGRESLTRPAAAECVVLIASPDRHLVEGLLPSFGERTKVVAAYDMFGLLQSSQRYLTTPLILLLDDEMPSIRPSSLATLARVMPPTTTIVQFGKRGTLPERRAQLPELTWRRIGDAAPHEILEACADLIPAPVPGAGPARQVVLAHGDPAVREPLAQTLRDAGHDVFETGTGFAALDRCIDELPAVVIAAREMPALDGHQLAALIATRFGADAPDVVILDPSPLADIGGTPGPGVTSTVPESDAATLLRLLRQG